MRTKLKPLEGKRDWFEANFVGVAGLWDSEEMDRHLITPPKRPIALLRNVCYQGREVTDHVWTSWVQQFDVAPGSRVEFLATVAVYGKTRRGEAVYDYKLAYPCWVQESGLRQSRPRQTTPQTRKEALAILNQASLSHQAAPDLYPLETQTDHESWKKGESQELLRHGVRKDWGVRVSQWDESMPMLIQLLIDEGWGDPNPGYPPYWMERSAALRSLEDYRDRTILQCCAIAAYCNGATALQIAKQTK